MGSLRNKKIDIVRAFALLLVIIYHSWVLTGSAQIHNSLIYRLIALGGEIGVTIFFILSGYGIYCSLSNLEDENGKINKKEFAKRRFIRIVPHYYLNIFVTLLLMDGGYYLGKEHFADIVSHLLFVHNLIPRYFGEINGVLWTMGVIVQFYVVSIILFKSMKKNAGLTTVCSIVFTIVVKAIVFKYITDHGLNIQLFVAGRQLFTALDNFVLGMFAAYLITGKKNNLNCIVGFALVILSFVGLMYINYSGMLRGIHTNNLSGYTWHSLLAIDIVVFMIGIANVNIKLGWINWIQKGLLQIAKYEYGIYIWHLLMMKNLLAKSPMIIGLVQKGQWMIVCLVFIVISIMIGVVMSIMVEGIQNSFKKIMHFN